MYLKISGHRRSVWRTGAGATIDLPFYASTTLLLWSPVAVAVFVAAALDGAKQEKLLEDLQKGNELVNAVQLGSILLSSSSVCRLWQRPCPYDMNLCRVFLIDWSLVRWSSHRGNRLRELLLGHHLYYTKQKLLLLLFSLLLSCHHHL